MLNKEDYKNIIINSLFFNGLISKELYLKCGKKPNYSLSSLSNIIKNRLNQFNEKYALNNKNNNIEHSICMDKDGEVLILENGTKDNVPIMVDSAFSKLINKRYKKLHDDYWSKNKITKEEYTEKIIKELNKNNNGIYHAHTHPGPYKNTDLNNPIPTCFSEADIKSAFLQPVTLVTGVKLYNVMKSQIALSTNGTSMMLINHNPIGTKPNFDEKKLMTAYKHLSENWDEYVWDTNDYIHYKIHNGTTWNQLEKYPNLTKNEVTEIVKKKVYQEINKRNHEHFPEINKDVIKEFDELGFELKYDFTEVNIK